MRLALCIAVGVFLGLLAWSRYEAWLATQALSDMERQFANLPVPSVAQRSFAPVDSRSQQVSRSAVWVPLAPDMTCAGGFVVLRMVRDGVPTLTDYVDNHSRVRCSGNSRLVLVH